MEEDFGEKIAGEIVLSSEPGKTLRKWRQIFGVSQKELAAEMGISHSVVSDYEGGRRRSPTIATVRRVVEALMAHGKVRRGYLGVSAQPVRLPASLAGQLGQETGLLVAAVASGSPAELAGVLLGDVVVGLGGQPVRAIDELLAVLSGAQIGASVLLRLVRGGQDRELSVVIGEQP